MLGIDFTIDLGEVSTGLYAGDQSRKIVMTVPGHWTVTGGPTGNYGNTASSSNINSANGYDLTATIPFDFGWQKPLGVGASMPFTITRTATIGIWKSGFGPRITDTLSITVTGTWKQDSTDISNFDASADAPSIELTWDQLLGIGGVVGDLPEEPDPNEIPLLIALGEGEHEIDIDGDVQPIEIDKELDYVFVPFQEGSDLSIDDTPIEVPGTWPKVEGLVVVDPGGIFSGGVSGGGIGVGTVTDSAGNTKPVATDLSGVTDWLKNASSGGGMSNAGSGAGAGSFYYQGGGDTSNTTNNNVYTFTDNSAVNNYFTDGGDGDDEIEGPGSADWWRTLLPTGGELPGDLGKGGEFTGHQETAGAAATKMGTLAGLVEFGSVNGQDITSMSFILPTGTVAVALPVDAPGIDIFRKCCLFALLFLSTFKLIRFLKI